MNKIKILLLLFIREAQSYCPQVIYFRTNHNDPDQLHSFRRLNDTYFENYYKTDNNVSLTEFIRGEPTDDPKKFNWKFGATARLPNTITGHSKIFGHSDITSSCPTFVPWKMECPCYESSRCVCGREEFYEITGPTSHQKFRSNCCDVLHHRYDFATCGGGLQNRIGIFNKINETVYEFVACKEERLSYFIYLDKSNSKFRWLMGPNLDPEDRLQHTPQSFALCPNNVVSWFSLCETYSHYLPKSRCGGAMWLPAQGPKCTEEALRSAYSYTVGAGDCCQAINITAEPGADFKHPEALGRYSLVSNPYPFPDSHNFSLTRARRLNDRVIYEKDSNSCRDKKYYLYYSAVMKNWHVSSNLNATDAVIYGHGSAECPSEVNNWYYLKNNTGDTWTPTAEFDERTRTSIDRMNIMCVHPNCCHKIDVSYNPDNPDPEKRNVTLTKRAGADIWVYNETDSNGLSNYTRILYRNNNGAWVYDNDFDSSAILEKSDDPGAHCPDDTKHWHDFCECFQEDDCWCGNFAWHKAPIPTCLDPPKDECFYEEIDKAIALERRRKAIVITFTIFSLIIAIGLLAAGIVAFNRKLANRAQIQEQYGRRKLSAMSRTSFEGFVGAHSDASHLISN